jgi:hypothetical protein
MVIGKRIWAIPEGHVPGGSVSQAHDLVSHEAACILNAGDEPAEIKIHLYFTLYFTDREPAGPYRVTVPARRTLHLRFNDLTEPEPMPRGTPYASVFESKRPDCTAAHTSGFARPAHRHPVDHRLRRRMTIWR